MKADLAYLGYKSSRVCQACYEILSKGTIKDFNNYLIINLNFIVK